MNKNIVLEALSISLSLLNNEIESVVNENLEKEYLYAIQKLELAIEEIKK